MEEEKVIYNYEYTGNKSVVSSLFTKVYMWMAVALFLTAATALYFATSQSLMATLLSNQVLFYGIFIAEFGLVVLLSSRISKLSFSTAFIIFLAYSILNGITMSVLFLVYTATSIQNVFLITGGMFGTMSLVGYFTKKDLSSMGKILYMALIGIIIASVVNIFAASSSLDWLISYIGVGVFVGLTAYDTQKIKRLLNANGTEVSDDTKKISLMGSLMLYLDFVNMFIYLLRLFGSRK
ncbi:MAG: Bax inhibitor-1/YccA family protein [Marinifilaceae bacterium]|jgi:FtsH-binding integral membrane protein|nr:Bax inhibitor-1/YccA family protein [Marinifilaceae bacterium]